MQNLENIYEGLRERFTKYLLSSL